MLRRWLVLLLWSSGSVSFELDTWLEQQQLACVDAASKLSSDAATVRAASKLCDLSSAAAKFHELGGDDPAVLAALRLADLKKLGLKTMLAKRLDRAIEQLAAELPPPAAEGDSDGGSLEDERVAAARKYVAMAAGDTGEAVIPGRRLPTEIDHAFLLRTGLDSVPRLRQYTDADPVAAARRLLALGAGPTKASPLPTWLAMALAEHNLREAAAETARQEALAPSLADVSAEIEAAAAGLREAVPTQWQSDAAKGFRERWQIEERLGAAGRAVPSPTDSFAAA